MKFDEPDLNLLNISEIKKLELESLFSTQKKTLSKPEELFQDILNFNLQDKTNDFYFYYGSYHNISNVSKTQLLSQFSVRKSRLNHKLKEYNLYIDRKYRINTINTNSLKYMMKSISSVIKNHIVSVRIFDTFSDDIKNGENIKSKIFGKELLNLLTKMIAHSNNVEIVSTFENEKTKNFHKTLLENSKQLHKDNHLDIYYIRKPLIHSSSLMYALIEDVKNRNYIIYYEKVTQWFVVEEVTDNIPFINKFWHLLDTRFNYYIKNKDLQYFNEVIPVYLDYFDVDFFDASEELINNLKNLLHTDFTSLNNGDAKLKIAKKINTLIRDLKKIKIAYPQTNKGNSILYHHIKLVETTLLLRLDDDLFNTREIVEQLFENNLTKSLCTELENEIKKDKFILELEDIYDIDLKKLKKEIIFGEYFNNKALSELFPNYNFITYEQIIISLNKIILNRHDSFTIISTCLSKKDSLNEHLFLNLDSMYSKIVLRAIFEHFFNIPFKYHIYLSLGEIEALEEVRFKKNKIPLIIKKYYKDKDKK